MSKLKSKDKIGIPLNVGDRVYFPSAKDNIAELKTGEVINITFDDRFKVEVLELLFSNKDVNQVKITKGETYFLNDMDLVNITEILLACPEFD